MFSSINSKVIGFLVILAFSIFILTSMMRFVFRVLYGVFPFLLIATLFINRSVFKDFFNKIKSLWNENWIMGLGATALSLVFLPLVSLYLFVKALQSKKEKPATKKEEWIPYEEIVEEPSKSESKYH